MEDYTKSQAVVLMAKAPLPGRVKTRLMACLGKEAAAKLAECMLLDRIENLGKISSERFLAFAPKSARAYFRRKSRGDFRLIFQGAGNLGARLSRIARKLFSQGFARIVFVGADSPLMGLSMIRRAFRKLRRGMDAAISPAQDGGYTLIGIRHSAFGIRIERTLGIFRGIPWGGRSVFKATLLRARRLRLKIGILPAGFDVDRPQDLEKLKRSLHRRRVSPRVFDFLTDTGNLRYI